MPRKKSKRGHGWYHRNKRTTTTGVNRPTKQERLKRYRDNYKLKRREINQTNEKECFYCHKEAVSRCSRCKSALYCTKECQLNHWAQHKSNCEEYIDQSAPPPRKKRKLSSSTTSNTNSTGTG
eukprot:6270_1